MRKTSMAESAFKLPSPCRAHGQDPCMSFKTTTDGGKTARQPRSPCFPSVEYLNRRPDLESLFLDALEISVDDVLSSAK